MFAKEVWDGGDVPENNEDLARAVRNWIDDTGLTQAKISALGGPSRTTMTKILTGKGSFRQAVFGQLDRALNWGEGGAMAAWRGEFTKTVGDKFDWRTVGDRELLDEVERRMKGEQDVRRTEAKKSPDDDGTPPAPVTDLGARRPPMTDDEMRTLPRVAYRPKETRPKDDE
jgi:hypothetical protein